MCADADDKERRKRRRRSVRICRQSDIITDVSSIQVTHPEESQPDVYGSLWYESQEPVIKKRRRRSSLLVGLATRLLPRQEEHGYDNENHHEVKVARFCEEKIECDPMNAIEQQEAVPDNYIHGIVRNGISSVRKVDTHERNITAPNKHEERIDSILEHVFDTVEAVGYMEEKDTSTSNIGASNGLNSDFAGVDTSLQGVNGNISLNSSNLCSRSPVTGDFTDMSKTSPCSMSPDFPISPISVMYQDESYIDVGNAEAMFTTNDNDECGMAAGDYSNAHNIKNANTAFDNCQKNSTAEQVSDLSLSDKENNVVTDNISLNITPEAKKVCGDKTSPGFMSLCKEFAGKIVNFVRTSPSFLTGSVVDNNITSMHVCASPDLKGNTCLNLVSKELCPKSDINKSLANLGADINAGNSSSLSCVENMKEVRSILCNCDIDTIHITERRGKQETSELLSCAKAINPVLLGSAKKKRDRKTFFDTFNAVSEELKRDRSTEDRKEHVDNEGGESKSDIGMEEQGQKPGVETRLEKVESTCKPLDIEEHFAKQGVKHDFRRVLSNSLDIVMESHGEKMRLKNNGSSVQSKSELNKNTVSVVDVNDTYKATDKQDADERIIGVIDDSDKIVIHEHTAASVPMDMDKNNVNDIGPVEIDTCVIQEYNKQPGNEVQISVELDGDLYADETLIDVGGYNVFANNTIVSEDNSCEDVINELHEVKGMRIDDSVADKDKRNICEMEAIRRRKRRALDIPNLIEDVNLVSEFAKEKYENVNESSVVELCENKPKISLDSYKEENYLENKSKKPTGRRRSGRVPRVSIFLDAPCMLEDLDVEQPNLETVKVKRKRTEKVVESKSKRKLKDDTYETLAKLYRNKNFVKPKEKKPWKTVFESPTTPSEVFGKHQLQRHIEFERPTRMKLRRRLQKAVKNGWDPKKRKRGELKDDYVQVKLAHLWSELDQGDDNSYSLQSKLRSIVETV